MLLVFITIALLVCYQQQAALPTVTHSSQRMDADAPEDAHSDAETIKQEDQETEAPASSAAAISSERTHAIVIGCYQKGCVLSDIVYQACRASCIRPAA